ncbi:hypothetical protein CCP4SC76_6720011 [Gammaproteobacteria bacterium]
MELAEKHGKSVDHAGSPMTRKIGNAPFEDRPSLAVAENKGSQGEYHTPPWSEFFSFCVLFLG